MAVTRAGRLLIVANRLPVTIRAEGDDLQVEPSIGGVATGLARLHQERGGLWFGWSGVVPPTEAMASRLDAELAKVGCVPLPLSAAEVTGFYQQTCNAVIWPVFHYLTERVPLEMGAFDAYREVNRRMADLVASFHQPGDTIWIHDYHFLLLPALLRERLPNARIGFFLHIPFPSSEIFRLLPEREALLDGLLGADLIGFHTAAYLRHVANALLVVNGIPAVADRIRMAGREVRLGVFPMGVDVDRFETLARAPETVDAITTTREGGGQILLAIDRLDYTKGVPRRLLAFEQLLVRHPELVGKVRLLNVAAPSRETVEAYREHRDGVDAVVGRINGRFGTATWVPVHYMYRSVSQAEVVALYRSADVMLVTPLRDGMNLVAKEYVASRIDDDGVLVMSEFAGAAAELGEATLVNPYDVVGTADGIYQALMMPLAERQRRIRAMRARVRGGDIHRWTTGFLESLDLGALEATGHAVTGTDTLSVAAERALKSDRLVLLLDYDGTLVPLDPAPERALPDQALLDLLAKLATRKRTQVHIVSGRSSGFLERWLGSLPVHLHGEFGGWYRDPEERVWHRTVTSPTGWQELVRPILTEFSRVTPGAAVEFKRECLAWHWRRAEPRFGRRQARELALHLTQLLANEPVEVLFGDQILEVRPQGMHKGKALARVTNGRPSKTLMVAIGDEPADDDLFRALPEESIRIRVGSGPTLAPIRVGSVAEVRSFLLGLVAGG